MPDHMWSTLPLDGWQIIISQELKKNNNNNENENRSLETSIEFRVSITGRRIRKEQLIVH